MRSSYLDQLPPTPVDSEGPVAAPLTAVRALDAIVVPAVRSSEHLDYAIRVSQDTASHLLVLCSKDASAAHIRRRSEAAGVAVIAPTIAPGYSHPWLAFNADTSPQARYGREANDVSVKRNIALVISKLLDWQRILFLDDDVRSLSTPQVTEITMALESNAAAGYFAANFPDNSVVRHAQRLSGVEPGVSLGGGTLGVNCKIANGFFPNIYNEDWFFLFAAGQRGSIASLGSVEQLPYNPFADPARPAAEEFGDVVAEGMREFLAAGIHWDHATTGDWEDVLERRKQLIGGICSRLALLGDAAPALAARQALRTAEARLATITARQCAGYVALWQDDLATWQYRLESMPHVAAATDALQLLRVDESL